MTAPYVFVAGALPDEIDLRIPGGTYQATPTYIAVDKAGQWFVTSMSGYGVPKGQFGIHLWYATALGRPWDMIRFKDKSHGNLTIIGSRLYFVTNDPDTNIRMSAIARWQGSIPMPAPK